MIDKYLGMPVIEAVGRVAERREMLRVWLKECIRLGHRDHPALGCVMPTSSADVARAGPASAQPLSAA